MMYILKKKKIDQILDAWAANYKVFAPQKVENYSQFLPYRNSNQLTIDEPHNTRYPPKSFFLPQSEVVLKYNRRLNRLEKLESQPKQRILFGIRPCDARAVSLLDTVFDTEDYPDPYWKEKREATIIIGMGCDEPCQTCFCTTVGSGPFDHDRLDALLTDLDEETYCVEVLSEKAKTLFSNLPLASDDQLQQVKSIQKHAEEGMEPAFDTTNLKQNLDSLFESDYWMTISESCLGCGICTFLCPTCFCFDIVDEVQRSERVRNWDTCMFRIYSQEASGHNPRPTHTERTRQRVMHKFSYWLDHIGKIGCTGCGRCVRYCPVGLDIRAMLRTANTYKSEVVNA
jgi:ferredoxin